MSDPQRVSLPEFLFSLGLDPIRDDLRVTGAQRRDMLRKRSRDVETALRKGWTSAVSEGPVARTTELLCWAEKEYPGQFVSYGLIAKLALELTRVPPKHGPLARRARRLVQRCRRRLQCTAGRELVVERGVGARATSDDADVRANVHPGRERRLRAIQRSLLSSVQGIAPEMLRPGHAPQLLDALVLLGGLPLSPEEHAHCERLRDWAVPDARRSA